MRCSPVYFKSIVPLNVRWTVQTVKVFVMGKNDTLKQTTQRSGNSCMLCCSWILHYTIYFRHILFDGSWNFLELLLHNLSLVVQLSQIYSTAIGRHAPQKVWFVAQWATIMSFCKLIAVFNQLATSTIKWRFPNTLHRLLATMDSLYFIKFRCVSTTCSFAAATWTSNADCEIFGTSTIVEALHHIECSAMSGTWEAGFLSWSMLFCASGLKLFVRSFRRPYKIVLKFASIVAIPRSVLTPKLSMTRTPMSTTHCPIFFARKTLFTTFRGASAAKRSSRGFTKLMVAFRDLFIASSLMVLGRTPVSQISQTSFQSRLTRMIMICTLKIFVISVPLIATNLAASLFVATSAPIIAWVTVCWHLHLTNLIWWAHPLFCFPLNPRLLTLLIFFDSFFSCSVNSHQFFPRTDQCPIFKCDTRT